MVFLLSYKYMSLRNLILSILDLAVWYLFIYYWIYSIKVDVFLPAAAGVLVILLVLGFVLCPLVPKSQLMQKLRDKKKDSQE